MPVEDNNTSDLIDRSFEEETSLYSRVDITNLGIPTPEVPQSSLAILINSAESLSGLADNNLINGLARNQKTHSISFETSSDVSSTQVIYEQGGTARGLNFVVEGGKLYAAVWNHPEESWGFKEMEVSIEANTKYTTTLVMDGALPADGTATLYLNGEAVSEVSGVGRLYAHKDNIGIGEVAQNTLIHGDKVSDTTPFSGTIENIAHYNAALEGSDLAQLHDYMGHGWLPPSIDDIALIITHTANQQNFEMLSAIIEEISQEQISELPPHVVGDALLSIANANVGIDEVANALAADAARNLLDKLGDAAEPWALGQALVGFANAGNFDGINAITDNISDQQAMQLPPSSVSNALLVITNINANPGEAAHQTSADAARDLLNKLSDVVEPYALGEAMLSFARSGNLEGINAVTESISEQQAMLLPPNTVGDTLTTISNNNWAFGEHNNQDVANTARELLSKLSAVTEPYALGEAMVGFAESGNFDGVSAVTEHLSDIHATMLPPHVVGDTLSAITNSQSGIYFNPATGEEIDTNQIAADAARDLLSKLSDAAEPYALGEAMISFARNGNFDGVDAVTDHISDQQAMQLPPNAVGETLFSITNSQQGIYYNPATGEDVDTNQIAADAARDLLSKLSDAAEPYALGEAMISFARNGNFDGVDAVTDHISDQQAMQLPPNAVGETLFSITNSQQGIYYNPATGEDVDTNQIAADAARDLLSKLSDAAEPYALGEAMISFARNGNFDGVDAVTDHISDQQAMQLPPNAVGETLFSITNSQQGIYYNPATGEDVDTNQIAADAARDLLSKLSDAAEPYALGEAMISFARNGNFDGVDAVTDHISDQQAMQLPPHVLGETLNAITNSQQGTYFDPATGEEIDTNQIAADATRDLLSKLSDFVETEALRDALESFENNGNLDAIQAIKDNISDEQAEMLKPADIVIVVDNSYDGSASDGSESDPFTDVQSAIDHAGSIRDNNDAKIVIQVMEGNSANEAYGAFTVDLSNIAIQGIDLPRFATYDPPFNEVTGKQPLLRDASGKALFGTVNVMEQNDVTIDGLFITESHKIGIYVAGSDTLGKEPDQIYSNISIINNVVTNTDSAGISVSGTRIFTDNPTIGKHYLENVLIQNNTVSHTNEQDGDTEAISLGAGTNNFQIIGNTVSDTDQYGIDVKVGAKDGIIADNHVYNVERFGIYLDSANRTIENVTIEDNLIHNVGNGIVLARETYNDASRDVGTEFIDKDNKTVTVDSNFIDIGIENNTIFSAEKFGVLIYRHNNKDGHDGIIDVDIKDNTIFDWGLNNTNPGAVEAEAIRIAPNLLNVDLINASLTRADHTAERKNLDSLKINGIEIMQGGEVVHPDYNVENISSIADASNNLLGETFSSLENETDADVNQNGTSESDIFVGDAENNVYAGHESKDNISGLGGDDALYGGAGNDFVRGNNGNDIIFGGDGNDMIVGDFGDDILIGDGSNTQFFDYDIDATPDFMANSGDDAILGGNGNDVLIGMSGDDTLTGGKGADTLYGNDGADTFVVLAEHVDGEFDTIKDFSSAENDVIDISEVLSNFDPLSDALQDFIQITDNGEDSSVFINASGDQANGFTQILTIEGVTGMTDVASLVSNGDIVI